MTSKKRNPENISKALELCREIKKVNDNEEMDQQFGAPAVLSLQIYLDIEFEEAMDLFREAKVKGDGVTLP